MTEKMPYHRRQGHERSDGFEDALIFGDLKVAAADTFTSSSSDRPRA